MSGYLWMAVGAVLWGVMGLFARIAGQEASFLVVCAVRALVGAAVCYGIARARGAPVRMKDVRRGWRYGILNAFGMGLSFYAITAPGFPLGDAMTLLNLTPIFVALLAPFAISERGGSRTWPAILVALAGVVLVIHPPFLSQAGHALPWFPVLVALTYSLSSSFAMLQLRQIGPSEAPEAIAIQTSLIASVIFGALALPHLAPASLATTGAILAAGVAAGFAQLAMTRAFARQKAAHLAPFGYLTAVTGVVLGNLVIGDPFTAPEIAGIVLVIAAAVFLSLPVAQQPQRAR